MEAKLYYTAPSDEIFEEIKAAATQIWSGYEDPYKTEKLNRIKDIGNVSDNAMYLVAMFDRPNQGKLASLLSQEACDAIRERWVDGGGSPDWIPF
jgi:hypothetical protein